MIRLQSVVTCGRTVSFRGMSIPPILRIRSPMSTTMHKRPRYPTLVESIEPQPRFFSSSPTNDPWNKFLRRYTYTLRYKRNVSTSSSNTGNGKNDSSSSSRTTERNKVLALYALAGAIAITGLSYAAVPLYKAFCQATGYGGTTQRATEEKFKNMKPVEGGRSITVLFNADTGASMPWIFKPQQRSVKVVPGETALAFYTAYNPTDKPITGVSTYNITPMRAGLYFNKVQCFCFEEQRLRAGEEIDMPIFFYIDPEFLNDPAMNNIKSLTLSYTFFRTGDQEVLDIQDEIRKQDAGRLRIINENDTTVGNKHSSNGSSKPELLTLSEAGKDTASAERIKQWTEEVAAKTGYSLTNGKKMEGKS